MPQDDFAALFEQAAPLGARSRQSARLQAGQRVEGTVLAISGGLVIVDVGGSADATIELVEFDERPIQVGDRLQATVAQARKEGSLLTLSLGRGGAAVGADVLRLAVSSGTPVSGTVSAAVSGGFSVEVLGSRAFCPISQIELGYVTTPEHYVGLTLDFQVIEYKEGGRNVVLSRRRLLDEQRKLAQEQLAGSLEVGATIEGTIKATSKHGAVVDLGGLEGFIHISELSRTRVENPEDVVAIGETVKALVLSIEKAERGLNVRLSLKSLAAPLAPQAGPKAEEVYQGKVVRHVGNGLIVSTSHGEGLVPTRELALPPGADHRRTYPVGRELEVVLVNRDAGNGRLRFSVDRVSDVLERNNYRDFGEQGKSAGALGSLGELMRAHIANLPVAAPVTAPIRAAAAIAAGTPAVTPPKIATEAPSPLAPASQKLPAGRANPAGTSPVVRRR